jgi:hypothetical protein
VVGVLQRVQPAGIYGSGPGVAVQAQLGDPLVGPASNDRLAGRMPRGMVVEATLGRALGITARPSGHIHGEHRRVGGRQDAHQQIAQPLGIDLTAGQRGVETAPAAPADRLQAQMRQRRNRRGAQQRVAKLEQRIGAAGEASVQLGPEAAEPREGEGWRRHGAAA